MKIHDSFDKILRSKMGFRSEECDKASELYPSWRDSTKYKIVSTIASNDTLCNKRERRVRGEGGAPRNVNPIRTVQVKNPKYKIMISDSCKYSICRESM